MKSLCIASGLLLLASHSMAADVSSTVGFTNDYRFAGISLSAGSPALQGSLDLAFDSGAYIGSWGSSIDWQDGNSLEIDYYAGYAANINPNLTYDVSLALYSYHGYQATDYDYLQANLKFDYQGVKLWYGYANSYFNSDASASYLSLDYSLPLTNSLNLDLHTSRSFGDYWKNLAAEGEYNDYAIGLSTSVANLDLSASWVSADTAVEINEGAFRNDDTLLISVSRTF